MVDVKVTGRSIEDVIWRFDEVRERYLFVRRTIRLIFWGHFIAAAWSVAWCMGECNSLAYYIMLSFLLALPVYWYFFEAWPRRLLENYLRNNNVIVINGKRYFLRGNVFWSVEVGRENVVVHLVELDDMERHNYGYM